MPPNSHTTPTNTSNINGTDEILVIPTQIAGDPLVILLMGTEMTLVSTILAAVPSRTKALLLNPLMRIFAAHGKVAKLLQWSIDLEVAGTQSHTTLFRSDSYASRMLSAFTKNVGCKYLRHVLSPTLRLIADNADSVNRLRVSTFEVDQDRINECGGRGGEGKENLQKLIAQVDCVIESVKRAEPLLPRSFRHVCRYLYDTVSDRFQDKNAAAGHYAVGSLLFLRFICPALTVPESFGIQMPRSRASSPVPATTAGYISPGMSRAERRSKVLITKLLQKVVSGIPYSADADMAMFPCNRFILEKRDEVRDMLVRVCDVAEGSIEHMAAVRNQAGGNRGGVVGGGTFAGMEEAVAHDLAVVQDRKGLHAAEALRTIRSILVQNFRCIDSEIPPVAFVLQNKFREALNISRSRKGSRNRSNSGSSNSTQGSNRSGGGKNRSGGVREGKKQRKKKNNKKKKRSARSSKEDKDSSLSRPGSKKSSPRKDRGSPSRDDQWQKDRLIGFLARDMGL